MQRKPWPLWEGREPAKDSRDSEAVQLDQLVPRGLAADDLHLVARAIERLRQQADQGFIRGGVHGRRGDFNPQFRAEGFSDFITRRARRHLDGEGDAVRLRGEEAGEGGGFTACVHCGRSLL